jgi:hypothetical protein
MVRRQHEVRTQLGRQAARQQLPLLCRWQVCRQQRSPALGIAHMQNASDGIRRPNGLGQGVQPAKLNAIPVPGLPGTAGLRTTRQWMRGGESAAHGCHGQTAHHAEGATTVIDVGVTDHQCIKPVHAVGAKQR